jgi:hypothetical protein
VIHTLYGRRLKMGLLDNMDIEQEENIATNTREATDDLIDSDDDIEFKDNKYEEGNTENINID